MSRRGYQVCRVESFISIISIGLAPSLIAVGLDVKSNFDQLFNLKFVLDSSDMFRIDMCLDYECQLVV